MAKMKSSLTGNLFVETRPKKLVKETENTRNTRQLRVTRLVKGTEVKESKHVYSNCKPTLL